MAKPDEMPLYFALMAIMVKYVSLMKDRGFEIDSQLTVEQSLAILAEAMTSFQKDLERRIVMKERPKT